MPKTTGQGKMTGTPPIKKSKIPQGTSGSGISLDIGKQGAFKKAPSIPTATPAPGRQHKTTVPIKKFAGASKKY